VSTLKAAQSESQESFAIQLKIAKTEVLTMTETNAALSTTNNNLATQLIKVTENNAHAALESLQIDSESTERDKLQSSNYVLEESAEKLKKRLGEFEGEKDVSIVETRHTGEMTELRQGGIDSPPSDSAEELEEKNMENDQLKDELEKVSAVVLD
jgi:hypothetical protein